MFGDAYIFVVFEDGTDLYWARSRVLEYIQQLQGVLPKNVSPMIGPDATGAGWGYEYAVIDRSHQHTLADLRSLQDWYLRYQLETVPGVAEVASESRVAIHVTNCARRGKGAAIRHGIRTSRARWVGFCDADLATPPGLPRGNRR